MEDAPTDFAMFLNREQTIGEGRTYLYFAKTLSSTITSLETQLKEVGGEP